MKKIIWKENNIFYRGMREADRRTAVRQCVRENRRFFSSKGYIYTLEVLIAISIIVLSVALILRNPPAKPEFSTSTIKLQGFAALEYLNEKGDIKNLVLQNNETELENKIKDILPREIQFETELCGFSCSEVNVPANETVTVINYYVSGYKESYVGKKVKLWLWRKS